MLLFWNASTCASCTRSDEPLYETWERFKSLLWRCPNHSFDDAAQLHIFYRGLKPQTKMILDASAGTSDYQSYHDRAPIQRKGIMEMDTQNVILAPNKLLTQQIEALTDKSTSSTISTRWITENTPSSSSSISGDHQNGHCSTPGDCQQEEEAHYLKNEAIPQQNFQGNYKGYRGGSGPSNNAYVGLSNRGQQQQQAQ
ncbi:hypothetical protein GmHk_02G004841 [Glycine max]|nr:hypothetical protein GmHk_02G004841 [Glycine max]